MGMNNLGIVDAVDVITGSERGAVVLGVFVADCTPKHNERE